MSEFKGKIAIITGGGAGIGRSLCEELAERGATVIIADISGVNAGKVEEAIHQKGGKAHSVEIDVSDELKVKHSLLILLQGTAIWIICSTMPESG